MEFDKKKYIYITIVAVLAILTLYATYSLIKNGHPIDKTQKEYLRDANKLHNDGKYEEAIESYMEAYDFDGQQSLVNYNVAVNSLKKNYSQLKEAFNEEGTQLDKNIDSALVVANHRLKNAAILQDDVEKYSEIYHNIGVAYHMRDSMNVAAEAYKEALRKNPANENARYNLAVILYQMKKDQQQQEQDNKEEKEEKDKEKEKQKKKDQQQQKQDNKEEKEEKDKEKEKQKKKDQQQQKQDNKEEKEDKDKGKQKKKDQQQQDPREEEKDEELEKIERELKALMQEERKLREKIDNADKVNVRRRTFEKNW